MKKLSKYLWAVCIFGAFFCRPYTSFSQSVELKSNVNKLATVFQCIDYFYTDTVDIEGLTETAIKAALKELDPHSVYMDKEETKEANEPLNGNFEGIGVQYQLNHDTIVVISPVSGGPSEKVGIIAGDKIVEVNGENATGKSVTINWVQKHLRGPKGSPVNVKVVRQNVPELLDFTIIRDVIPLYSVDAHYMVDKNIGYIKLSKFARTSIEEIADALNDLRSQGMKKLIFDLRNNSGGYLDVAVSVADQFLPIGKLIVYTQGRMSPKKDAVATADGIFEDGDLVILINEGSASASEIVSGAVQDWDRGTLVGRRSFGKGLVQRPFSLADSSQIRLTIARYYTPSGRCIQKPYDGGSEEYFKELSERLKHGEFVNQDSISFPDSLKYTTASGRTVYGGGGIMPDVFVPLDTTAFSSYYKSLNVKGLQAKFCIDYVNSHRKELNKKYPDSKTYIDKFKVTDDIVNDFISFVEKNDIEKDMDGYNQSKNIIDTQLKALIGRDLFDMNTYYQIANPLSDEFNIAIELLNK